MDKILAINTIKNVFSALGAKTSDSNYAVALLDKTSAEPKGMMDFANLASVLGGIMYKGFIPWTDNPPFYTTMTSVDDAVLPDRGVVFTFVSKNLSNLPSAISNSTRFFLVVFQSSTYDLTQIVWNRGSNQLYLRCRQGNELTPPITWSSWKEL